MKIQGFLTHNLRNDAHFQFHTEFRDLMIRHNPQILKVKPQFDTYVTFYEREDEALKKIIKSALTKKIHEADRARDETFAGMAEINRGMCKHFIKETAEAAQRIKIVMDTYGNIARKPLNEQTSAVYNLLHDLRSDKYAKDAADSGIDVWANELEKRNAAFESLVKERFDEFAHRTDIVMKDARVQLDNAYHAITERIDAFSLLEGTADYEEFAKTLNVVIAKYSVRHHRHKHNHPAPLPELEISSPNNGDSQ